MDIENRFTIQTIVEKSGNLWLNSVIPMRRPLLDYRNQFNELEGNKLQELLTAKLVYAKHLNSTWTALKPSNPLYR